MLDRQKNSTSLMLIILNLLFNSLNQAFITIAGPIARLLNISAWQMGLIISMVGITWVFSVRFWGKLSDRYGRINILKYSLLGLVISCIVFTIYIYWSLSKAIKPSINLTIFFLLCIRILIGFFACSIPVSTNAWIADNYTDVYRIKLLSKVAASGAIGMIFAPFIAGWLGYYDLVLVLAFFSLLPLLLIPFLINMKDTSFIKKNNNKHKLTFKDKRIFSTWLANFIAICSVIISNECLGFYLIDKLKLPLSQATIWLGIILSSTGIAFIFAQIILNRLKHCKIEALICYGSVLGAIGFCVTIATPFLIGVFIGYLISGFGIGLALPSISGLAMNSVNKQEQGKCASVMASAQGLALVVAPICGTSLYDFNNITPFFLIIFFLLYIAYIIYLKKLKHSL